ncbi:TetR family transcriptional regulator C-terminal domain-containing protein [Paractinoplanes durhamensis]|uniref:TetR family transcriptional regulator C-terminal domain-containing protein n=1 Tax=Paractinoplanes durhamensis TaxID=113563 RepID=UPI00363F6A3B
MTAELIRQWLEALVIGIHRMQAAGEIAAAVDAERAAAALIAGIQGGVIIFLSTGRITHLEAALDVGIEGLRASTRLF